jgi:5-(carboxyamino)imidazole ribonucleotide synthase
MIGGGQLARMTQQAAIPLGIRFRVLSERADDSAALVCADTVIGSHTNRDDVEQFAAGCDVVTFDHEHVPQEILHALEEKGVAVRPGSQALHHAQDKATMRARLAEIGAPLPRWRVVEDVAELNAFGSEIGWPVVVKAIRGGYDGKGVWVLDEPVESLPAPSPVLVEEFVAFRRELAAVVARSPHGQAAAYPVVETVQQDGICVEVLAPAPGLSEERAAEAQELALRIGGELGVVGILAVELFETDDGVMVNELAMRPHNSGHWSIEGAVTSQFEQHLRAVLDLPLGATHPTAPVTVMVNVLGGDDPGVYGRYEHVMAHDPGVKVHMYGKGVRPGRKIGHVTVQGDDLEDVRRRAWHAAVHLRTGEYV